MKAIRSVAQHVIGASPDDNAGPLFRNLPDNIVLHHVELIEYRLPRRKSTETRRRAVHEVLPRGCVFTPLFDKLLCEPALFRNLFYDFPVVKFPTEFIRDVLCDDAPARTELSADSDDFYIHHIMPLYRTHGYDP